MNFFKEIEKGLIDGDLLEESTLNKIKHDYFKGLYRGLKKSKKCIVIDCDKDSIKKSHTISKSSSLKRISEDSHVLAPRIDIRANEMEKKMIYVGIGEATIFPGYCLEHESLFEKYERNNSINSEEDIILQTYRSACREIVVNEARLNNTMKSLLQYNLERNNLMKARIQKFLRKDVMLEYVKYDDYRIDGLNKNKLSILSNLEFSMKIYKACWSLINNIKDESIFVYAINLDLIIPIALSGIGHLNVKEKNEVRAIKVLVNVIPFEAKTIIIIAGETKDSDILKPYYESLQQHPFIILNFIESFMMHGSDHWYIKPSIWNKMHLEKKTFILNYFFNTERAFIEELNFSIFDDIRLWLIEYFDLSESEYFKKELLKLSYNFNQEQVSD